MSLSRRMRHGKRDGSRTEEKVEVGAVILLSVRVLERIDVRVWRVPC